MLCIRLWVNCVVKHLSTKKTHYPWPKLKMKALTATPPHRLPLPRPPKPSAREPRFLINQFSSNPRPATRFKPSTRFKAAANPLPSTAPTENDFEPESESVEDGFEIEVKKVAGKKNRRIIESRIRVDADLETVWRVLTDYEGLAEFIPGLSVSQLVEKGEKFARLYQVGRQNLALGLKFDAKGILDCYERDVEHLPNGRRRGINFKMIEGDFKTFEGTWSIEQIDCNMSEEGELVTGKEFQTILSYTVELEPKFRLPVRLLEGRLCGEVKNNLICVREEAQRVQKLGSDALPSIWESEEDNPNLGAVL